MSNPSGIDPLDFMAFILTYLREHLKKETPGKILSDFHYELCHAVQYDRAAIAAPRGFAKSTFLSFFYPIYLLLERPGSRVVIVSATYTLSEFLCSKIRDELSYNEKIQRDYGHMLNKGGKKLKWADGEFTLPNNSACAARGYGQQIRGFRPTNVMLDDLENDEMVASSMRRNKFDEWFNSSLTNTLVPGTQMLWIGTILDPDAALANVVNRGRAGWKTLFYQAISNGKSIWEEMWPLEELEKRRAEIGESAFAQEFMNDPIRAADRTFKKEWFRYFEEPPKNLMKFMTVDPAINLKTQHDYTAMVVCGTDDNGNWYVLEYVRKKLLPKESVDHMFEMCIKHNIHAVGIEEVAFQAMLSFEFKDQRASRGVFTKVIPLKSMGRRKSLRIESLQPRYESGKIFHRRGMEDLETELLRFPSPRCHDDLIDALSYMNKIARKASPPPKLENPDSFGAILERRRRGMSDADDVYGFDSYFD